MGLLALLVRVLLTWLSSVVEQPGDNPTMRQITITAAVVQEELYKLPFS
jgi:hypothetical protein